MRTLVDILPEVRSLSQADKLRLMHALVHDLALEAQVALPEPGESQSVWSPYDSFDAADTLLRAQLRARKGEPGHAPLFRSNRGTP